MSGEEVKQPKKIKASEKLKNLEGTIAELIELYNDANKTIQDMQLVIYNMSRDKEIQTQALKLLNEKQQAIVDILNKGLPLSDENLNEAISQIKEKDLVEKVDEILNQGIAKPVDTIGENSLMVAREVDEDGKVVNRRLQVMVNRLAEEQQQALIGLKVGDLYKTEGDLLNLEIMEVYNFVEPELTEELSESEAEQQKAAE